MGQDEGESMNLPVFGYFFFLPLGRDVGRGAATGWNLPLHSSSTGDVQHAGEDCGDSSQSEMLSVATAILPFLFLCTKINTYI